MGFHSYRMSVHMIYMHIRVYAGPILSHYGAEGHH